MMLIIAWGNPLRSDDAAGLRLGELLEELWRERKRPVRRITVHQLTPELALEIARDDVSTVVFADARDASAEAGGPPPEILVRPLLADPRTPVLGHHLDPAAVMACARLLYHKASPAWIATVPGVDFGHGEGLSDVAEAALSRLPEALFRLTSE
ncbi:hydrogenase maturation protease [Desulfococcus sp.]|uniref:hydrogenase maturation protease n=1 Tax=Desulfococcus sp. TaxID=2025834 RepID=UPI0035940AFA